MVSSWASSRATSSRSASTGDEAAFFALQFCDLARDLGFLGGEAARARVVFRNLRFELAPLGPKFRRLGGERGKGCIGLVQRCECGFGAGRSFNAALLSRRLAP